MKAFVSLLVAALMVAFAGDAFATKLYKEVVAGKNCVGDSLISTNPDTIDFVFQAGIPYSTAAFGICFDSTGAHGTLSAKSYYFPGTVISARDEEDNIVISIAPDTLVQTSFPDSVYWQKPSATDSTAILTFVDESCYWSDGGFQLTTAPIVRVIVSLSSGTVKYAICLNVMTQ